MSYSAITQPHTYSNGYSFMPLRLEDTNVGNVEKYKYIVNILYNKITMSTAQTVDFDGNVYTKLTFGSAHEFKRGDIVFLKDSTGTYTGLYTVMSVPSTTTIIIDLEIGVPLTGTITVSNVIKYNPSPSPDGDVKLDLSNTIKDFVTQNLSDVNEIFAAPDTRFEYDLMCGYEGNALFEFSDNAFQSGLAGFVNSGMTATTQTVFQVGDEIIIQQELYSWPYLDNFFSGGLVGFTGDTQHYFTSSDTITVTGQITHPSYNGQTGLYSTQSGTMPGASNVVTDKAWLGSSAVEPGILYGVITPEYNTTATITDIVYSAGTGVIIVTDIPWAGTTPPIAGTIKHADGRVITSYEELSITGLSAFNSYVNHLGYSISEFDEYVVQNRAASSNCISSIYDCANTTGLTSNLTYRIEPSTKSWLLAHVAELGYATRAAYIWRDSNNNVLGISSLSGASSLYDFYFPVGIDQVYASTLRTDSVPMSGIVNSIDNYYVYLASNAGTVRTNFVHFEVNDDCSKFEVYHLIWKDAKGSWISYPFKYLSQDTIDVDRKNYYQTPGNWSNNSFDFNSFDRGDRTFFARSRKKVTINSGWIVEFENDLIVDMMKSACVYLQLPDGTLVGATIDEKTITLGKDLNEQIWNYTFTVIYSLDEIRL